MRALAGIKNKNMRQSILIILLIIICNYILAQDKEVLRRDGSIKYFQIDSYTIKPKRTFYLNNNPRISHDTIFFIVCSDYIYYPFGQIKSKGDFNKSLLRTWHLTNVIDSIVYPDQKTELNLLDLNNNRVITFIDNDIEAVKSSYILKGELNDQSAILVNNIKIGMSSRLFYDKFFDDFPVQLNDRFQFIVFETCVDGLKHVYSFSNGILNKIRFGPEEGWTFLNYINELKFIKEN